MGIVLILPFMISFGIFTFNYYSIFGDNNFTNFNLLETYECGFDTFHNKIILYNLQFLNIRVSYIIFDLEISIIFGWLIFSFKIFNVFKFYFNSFKNFCRRDFIKITLLLE